MPRPTASTPTWRATAGITLLIKRAYARSNTAATIALLLASVFVPLIIGVTWMLWNTGY